MNRTVDHKKDAASVKRRLAVLSMAACVALSGALAVPGCGVMEGMERAGDAKQTKRQVEKQGEQLEKELREGQEDPEGR